MKCLCDYCGKETEKSTGHYNRAKKLNAGIYCNKECAGLSRRSNKTVAEKKIEKAEYDKSYRDKNLEKKQSAAKIRFKQWYYHEGGQETERVKRKAKMPKHVEYCRRPEYKKWKKEYDRKHRAKKQFGEFGEAAIILEELERELFKMEIPLNNHVLNNAQKRKRTWQRKLQN